LGLREKAREADAVIVACLRNSAGLERVIAGASEDNLDVLHAYSVIEEACTPAHLFELSVEERLARAIHADYINQRELRSDGASEAALVPWDELSPSRREANRAQARDIGAKVRSLGYRIVPLTRSRTDAVVFSPEEIETLARAEHARWCAERMQAGYVLGPRTDHLDGHSAGEERHKSHPDLVSWDELDEDSREKDRDAVRAIPDQLRLVGAMIAKRPD
jgi:hypothetical protein